MATYSQFQLDTNRHAGQTAQNITRNALIFVETSLKFLFGFIGQMIRMIMGK